MLTRPRLKACLKVATVDDDKLFLQDENDYFMAESRTAVALAPLLDGMRTLADILAALSNHPIQDVLGELTNLERRGHLVEGSPLDNASATAYWDARGVPPTSAAAQLSGAGVELRVLGSTPPDIVSEVLEAGAMRLAASAPLQVVLVDDYLDERLRAVNDVNVAEERSWIVARLTGTTLWLGPRFDPPSTACWACLALRLEGNRQLDRYLATRNGRARTTARSQPMLATSVRAGAALLTTELQASIAGSIPPRLHDLVTVDLTTLQTERHTVIRQPRCAVCAPAELRDARPSPRVVLTPQPKVFTADGGHRVMTPDETYERLVKHISPLTGAVTSVERQTAQDNGVAYSYASGHNFALMQDSVYFLRKNLRGRSGGKGRTDQQARVGAVCEAIERYNGVYRGDEAALRASYSQLSATAIHPADLLRFSERQYNEREAWNAGQRTSYHIVPQRLDDERPIDWTTAWSLTADAERHVPSAYCWFGHPDIAGHFFCASDANGCAAGNTVEEAILQGLMELVERDAVALWWYNRLPRAAVDLDAFGEPYVELVRDHYRALDRDIWMLDLTTDVRIPAFCAVSRRLSGPSEDILLGFGAHVDPRMAVMRALTEVNQFLPAVTSRRPDGSTKYWTDDPDAIEWWTTARAEDEPYVLADVSAPASGPGTFEEMATDDLSEDVRRCVARLAGAGLEVIVLDQTRAEIELAVVKVMVPGLRHFWRRLGPGRLYDVPVAAGWLPAPLAEADLNPRSIFF